MRSSILKATLKCLKTLVVSFIIICLVIMPALLLGLFYGYSRQLPSVEELKTYNPGLITRLYDINDNLLASFYIERREIVPLDNIPVQLQQAVIAVEDSNFLSHRGIDPSGILRAMLKNLMAAEIVQGGSTITQQVARAIFLTPEKKWARKIKEAILAYRLEKEFTKTDILWLYLNHIYFGHGAYGVEAAARTYFGKHVSQLNLTECAMLAGLPKAPSHYSPSARPEAARLRMKLVLTRMMEEQYITMRDFKQALEYPLTIQGPQGTAGGYHKAPYFTEHIRRYLEKHYGGDLLYKGGLRVYTTIDPHLQEIAEKQVAEGVRVVDKRRGYRGPQGSINLDEEGALENFIKGRNDWAEDLKPEGIYPAVILSVEEPQKAIARVGETEGVLPLESLNWVYVEENRKPENVGEVLSPGDIIQVRVSRMDDIEQPLLSLEQEPEVEGALVCMNPLNGQIMAMVGGYSFGRSQFNRAVQSRRQPGSAFKPFVYATAIENGMGPADIIVDSPIVFENPDEESKIKKWKPVNYEEHFYGPTRLREALNHSRNLSTIKLLKKIGVKPVIELARRLGIKSPLANDLSLALGSSGVTLLELTAAYSVFDNKGVYTPPMFIRYITDRRGTLLEVHQPRPRRAMDEDSACIINNMLQTVVQEGTGRRVRALRRPAGGKTGTTNEFIDAWFVGFTPQLVTGVWVGIDELQPLGKKETGSRAAAPIWLSFMKEASEGMPVEVFQVSSGVVFVRVDADSGLLASPNSREAIFEVFRRGDEPKETASPEADSPTDFFRLDLGGL